MRATVREPAATGRKEKHQAAAEAQPEGDISKHKRQPADRRKCSAGGLGSVPTAREEQWRDPNTAREEQWRDPNTAREEQWRDPKTSEDTQPQRGPPGKNAQAAAGR